MTTENSDARLKREIGTLAAGFLVLNGIIGAGIFGLPGRLAEVAGDFSPWLFIIFGILIITVVWSFAAISSYFSSTGGPIVYVTNAFGPLIGFQTGWLFYVGRLAAFAANVNLLFDYASYIWDGASVWAIRSVMIFIVVGGLTIINILGIKKAVQAINVLTFLKLVPIFLVILLGLQYLAPENMLPPDLPQFDDAGAVILLIFFAFTGFESVLASAGETKNPQKTIPRALISVFIIVTIIYFLLQLVYVTVAPPIDGDAPLIGLGRSLIGPVGGTIIIFTAIFSILGNVAGITIFGSRSSFAMAHYGALPMWFGKVHEKYSTPSNSLIFQAVFVYILAVSGTFVYLAIAGTLARMIAYSICILALPKVMKNADQETRENATKIPGGFIIPFIGLLVCIFAMTQSELLNWQYLLGFVAVGSVLYFININLKKKQ
ncbi:MAG: amino acid permease [Kordiimonadaceae bacterium]|nr:amino acid permease [Kordiimonadaceae bacterium]MBT6330815.1 amino acid permease [Kordiimonadaceae bacterium]MBT7582259.1 amino acid permease [Kordiimonadaceae bacterium]